MAKKVTKVPSKPLPMTHKQRMAKIDYVVHVFGGREAFTYAKMEHWKDAEIDYAYERAKEYVGKHDVVDFEDLN